MDAFILKEHGIGSQERSFIHGEELSATKPTDLFASMRQAQSGGIKFSTETKTIRFQQAFMSGGALILKRDKISVRESGSAGELRMGRWTEGSL